MTPGEEAQKEIERLKLVIEKFRFGLQKIVNHVPEKCRRHEGQCGDYMRRVAKDALKWGEK